MIDKNDLLRVDTHRHLGGCIGIDFVWQTIQAQELRHLAETRADVVEQMTFKAGEPYQFHRFLDKFKILDELPWTANLLEESISHVCRDLAADYIDYCWMDFSINKYMDSLRWHKREVIGFIYDCFERFAPGKVGLVLSLKYESSRAGQKQYARLIEEDGIPQKVIGIDLVGDENYFDASFYRPLFRDWNAAGKITRAHVAESCAAENARLAIQEMGATDIAHGIKLARYPELMRLARDQETGFHVAINSNYMTGAWPYLGHHPIRAMYDAGLRVMVGTDDPVQLSLWEVPLGLDGEYEALERLGFTDQEIVEIASNAVKCSRRHGLLPSSPVTVQLATE